MDKYDQKWVSWIFRQDKWAITIGCVTFYSCDKSLVTDRWKRHEDRHKEQWSKGLYIGFLVKYVYCHIKYGYWNNPYEVEARKAEV